MIQRIQTVYLALAILLSAIGYGMDWAIYHIGEETFVYGLTDYSSDQINNGLLAFVLSALVAMLFIGVLQFKNRKKQMRTVRIAMWTALLTFIVFGVEHYYNIEALRKLGVVEIEYSFVVVFPLLTSILCWMAYRAIKKDENLVRSVDRLR